MLFVIVQKACLIHFIEWPEITVVLLENGKTINPPSLFKSSGGNIVVKALDNETIESRI